MVSVQLINSSVNGRCRMVHLERKHALHPVETSSHAHVPEWHSGRAVACKSLDRIMRLPMPGQVAEQRIDVRAVALTAVQRVRKHLADDLVVLDSRAALLVLIAMPGCSELLGRGHRNRGRGDGRVKRQTMGRSNRSMQKLSHRRAVAAGRAMDRSVRRCGILMEVTAALVPVRDLRDDRFVLNVRIRGVVGLDRFQSERLRVLGRSIESV